jgi:glycosyltransferase involved in cell wall biosynthesis
VWALAGGLAARPDVELHVVTAVPGLRAPETAVLGSFILHRVPHPRGDRLFWHQPLVRPLSRTLDAIGPDVVHAHMAGPYADAALRYVLAKRRHVTGRGQPGRPVPWRGHTAVITLHGVMFREAALALAHSSRNAPVSGTSPIGGRWADRARWTLDAWYERWIVRRATDLIAISPYVTQEYRPFTRARFHGIENPVADAFFDVPTPPLAPPFDRLRASSDRGGMGRVLCVARLIPRKDILTLIETFARVVAALPTAILEIAGQTDADPAYTAACMDAVHRLGLESSVRFLGSVGGPALTDCYTRADVVLLTSRQETAPVVVAEAMAAARPVVATRVGGVPFMVQEGETGFLAEPGDAAGLAEATIRLLARPDLRRAFGQAGRAEAERRFRLASVVERTVALYRNLIND